MRAWLLTLLLAGAATALTLLPVCDFVFRCGCTWPLLGGYSHCNIHNPAPPHCPVCADWGIGVAFTAAVFAAWTAALMLARVVVAGRGGS